MGAFVFLVIAFLFGVYAMRKNSGCLLTVFVVVFFLGGILALNGEGLHPALSFLIVVAATIAMAFVAARFPGSSVKHVDVSLSDPQVKQVLDEAVMVVNDMVYAAESLYHLHTYSEIDQFEEFRGTIYVNTSDARPVGSKFDISLVNTRDLSKVLDDFDERRRQGKIHPREEEVVLNARIFIMKYGKYCVTTENGEHEIIYPIVNPLFEFPKRNDSTQKLFALIKTAIRERCSGVEIQESESHLSIRVKSILEKL